MSPPLDSHSCLCSLAIVPRIATVAQQTPDDRMGIGNRAQHQMSSRWKLAHSSRRAWPISLADGAGPRSAHRPHNDLRGAGRVAVNSRSMSGTIRSIRRALSNGERCFTRSRASSKVTTLSMLHLRGLALPPVIVPQRVFYHDLTVAAMRMTDRRRLSISLTAKPPTAASLPHPTSGQRRCRKRPRPRRGAGCSGRSPGQALFRLPIPFRHEINARQANQGD